jgi:thioredoxin 1
MEDKIKHIESKEEFDKIINSDKPVLVDFFATWCGPCKMMGVILEDMAKDYKNIDKVEIVKVDIDQNRELSREYDIMSVPTMKIFSKGKEVNSYTGMRPVEVLEEDLNKLI